jgi:hypothetical protein
LNALIPFIESNFHSFPLDERCMVIRADVLHGLATVEKYGIRLATRLAKERFLRELPEQNVEVEEEEEPLGSSRTATPRSPQAASCD